jgi:hypothetical protein
MKLQKDGIKSNIYIKNKIIESDEMIEEYAGLLKQVKNNDVAIEHELKSQMPLLRNLEELMDRVNSRIKGVSKKFNVYLEKSTNSCLMTMLCIQVVILLLVLLVL